jgi:nitrogen fixation/metabolism regulation signal transduction histidine kinase
MQFGGHRRRTIVVDRSFQYKAAIVGVLYILAVALVLAVPLYKTMDSVDALLLEQGEDLQQAYHSQRTNAIALGALFVGGLIVSWTLFSLWRTHRVAGPVVKITRHIHDIAAGHFDDPVALRSGDELQALADALNAMARGLKERDQTILAGIQNQIDIARSELASGHSPEALDRLARAVREAFSAPDGDANDEVENLMRG